MRKLRYSGFPAVMFAALVALAADYAPPGGDRYPLIGAVGTILPGGRFLKPLGTQVETGPQPSALAISPRGLIATADIGLEHHGITIIEPGDARKPGSVRHLWARTPHGIVAEMADPDWLGVAAGIAFDGEKSLWISEGDSGKIRQLDAGTGDRRKLINLNGADWHGSVTGALIHDPSRHAVYVADRGNDRIAIIDTRKDRVVASVPLGRGAEVSVLGLSPDGAVLYAATAKNLAVIDVRNSLEPAIASQVDVAEPGGILALPDRVYVSNAESDTITIISAVDRKITGEIRLAIPGLEKFRGIRPAGLAYDPLTKWLLVAASGINAIGVIDTEKKQLIGLIPAGWMPTSLSIVGDRVWVVNERGRGTGPYVRRPFLELGAVNGLHRGTVTTFIVPDTRDLATDSGVVMALNGFSPAAREAAKLPAGIRHVVMILKENRTFDEILGDITKAGNGAVAGAPPLARFGMSGVAHGGKVQFSVKDVPITPNQHAMAGEWAFSDNFYVDGDDRRAEELAIAGAREHLRNAGITVRDFDDPAVASDQVRADRFIAAIKTSAELPQVVSIRLPNDRGGQPAENGLFPYEASFVADNDFATGRIVEYLSHSKWWPETLVLIVDTDTEGSFDHIDSHRTLLIAAGPWVKKGYVSHTNASFSGLFKAVFRIVGAPPLDLPIATAPELGDLFTAAADLAPFTAIAPDKRIFDPGR